MRNRKVFSGIMLILLAVVLMGSAMGIIPDIPWFKIIISTFFAAGALKGFVRRDFFAMIMSISMIVWIFDEELKIDHLAPFPLLIAAACLGIGLNMIIGRKHLHEDISFDHVHSEHWQDGRHVSLENNFNVVNKYVNSAAFSSAKLENNFGSANIYFNNAVIANGEAKVELNNNFGKMNIYLPNTWRMKLTQDAAFGNIAVFGEPNRDMDAPVVVIQAESNFGSLNIYFD